MLTPNLTLKDQLDAAVTRYGLAEVLDRLVEIMYISDHANGSQIIKLLEEACQLSLVEADSSPDEKSLTIAS